VFDLRYAVEDGGVGGDGDIILGEVNACLEQGNQVD